MPPLRCHHDRQSDRHDARHDARHDDRHGVRHDTRRMQDEQGAVAVIMALLVSVLVAASVFGANSAALMAVRRETQRAADLSALDAAASLPLVGILDSGKPQSSACNRAGDLLTDLKAPLGADLATAETPTCDNGGVTVEARTDMPLIDTAITTADDAIATLRQAVADALAAAGLDPASNVCDPLVAPTLDLWLTTLTDVECSTLQGALDGLPHNLAPAVLTPRVRVTVEGTYHVPVPLPTFGGDRAVGAEAEARRRFKNLVVVPPVRGDTLTGLLEPVTGGLVDGVPMPLDEVNLNPTLASVRDDLLPLLHQASDELEAAVNPYLPPEYQFSLDGLVSDVADLYDPPTTATPPSPLDVAAEAVQRGEPVVLLRLFRMPVLGIPALDVTAAYLDRISEDTFQAVPIPASQLSSAQGLFGASLRR